MKVAFGSDYMIQEKINHLTNIKHSSLLFINDINSYDKQIYGKCQDLPSLHRLSQNQHMHKVSNIFEENMQLELP